MDFNSAEEAIIAYAMAQWALGAHSGVELVFDNTTEIYSDTYLAINVEGTISQKTIFGSAGKRSSIEAGIVFIHAFVPTGSGKRLANNLVVTMSQILELRTIATGINLEGANPPSPVDPEYDRELGARTQPQGAYYRCSGSIPFILIDVR